MTLGRLRLTIAAISFATLSSSIAFQTPRVQALTDPFGPGWMVNDTNGDGIADFISGKVVVPAHPTATENAAAADLAARLGFATTGFTPPVVITAAEDRADGPRIYVAGSAAPAKYAATITQLWNRLGTEEGGVFILDGNLIVLGHDDAGLLAAAEAFAARAPYIWRPNAERVNAIAQSVNASAALTGVTYLKGKAGINRAYLQSSTPVSQAALETALANNRMASVHELQVTVNGAVVLASSAKALAAIPPPVVPAGDAAAAVDAAPAAGGDADAGAAGPARLDLATLYTMRGLFRGTPRMPIPSNLDGQLYVPAGIAGIAMANLAARMGLETTGITLPLATPASNATARDVRTKSVVEANSELGKEAERKLRDEDTAASEAEPPARNRRRRTAHRR